MKHTYLYVLLPLTLISCKKVGSVNSSAVQTKDSIEMTDAKVKVDCSDYQFKDENERADTLKKYVALALTVDDKTYCDRVIFYSFPNSYEGMLKLFGFDKVTKAAPLYTWPIGQNVIKYFGSIQSIPKDVYYEKYINICVGGCWEADNIQQAFGLYNRLIDDTKSVCPILSKRTDVEIFSVFRFIFDGPHPKNKENALKYEDLAAKLMECDSRLSDLLKKAYEEVLLQDDGHGK